MDSRKRDRRAGGEMERRHIQGEGWGRGSGETEMGRKELRSTDFTTAKGGGQACLSKEPNPRGCPLSIPITCTSFCLLTPPGFLQAQTTQPRPGMKPWTWLRSRSVAVRRNGRRRTIHLCRLVFYSPRKEASSSPVGRATCGPLFCLLSFPHLDLES